MTYDGDDRRDEALGRRMNDGATAVVIDGMQNGAKRDFEELLLIARAVRTWLPRAVAGLFALTVTFLGWVIRQEVADDRLAKSQGVSDVRAAALATGIKELNDTDRQILEALSAIQATQEELREGIGRNYQDLRDLRDRVNGHVEQP